MHSLSWIIVFYLFCFFCAEHGDVIQLEDDSCAVCLCKNAHGRYALKLIRFDFTFHFELFFPIFFFLPAFSLINVYISASQIVGAGPSGGHGEVSGWGG